MPMRVSRERQLFPTRNYPYERQIGLAAAGEEFAASPNVLYRRVGGIDTLPKPMAADELDLLEDPFGKLLRSGAAFPLSLRSLLAAVDGLPGAEALPAQLVFLVADGGHIPWTEATDELERSFRIAVARGNGEFHLLVSSSTRVDSTDDAAFLQVIGWDRVHEVFHFYERLQGTYFWAGMSHHALEMPTRGKGPFDSHINGALVMKELRAPWIHWHAPQAGINQEAFAPDDPLRDEPLFRNRVTAERLEIEVVRPGIRRWNSARVRKAVDADGVWRNVHHFLRQAAGETTVNLASSETASHLLEDGTPLRPPLSFFLNRDTLFDTLALEPDDEEAVSIIIPGRHYRSCLRQFDVHRSDGSIRVEGDTHFAFLTPEAAFEDTNLVDALMIEGLLGPRLAASLTMVDFPNPVFSARRTRLLRYVPQEIVGPSHAETLESAMAGAVRAAIEAGVGEADRPDSPEREFIANLETSDWEDTFRARIATYLEKLRVGAEDAETVEGWFRLMEHRRRLFRRRKLAEFKLTTPRTNIPETAPGLRMTASGKAEPISQEGDEP